MAFTKKVVGMLLAFASLSQVSAMIEDPVYAGRCGADMTVCRPESYETTTIYEVDPIYTTFTDVETSVKIVTTTSTSIVPVVTTVTSGSQGLCQIITTTRIKKPQIIPVTMTVTSVVHQVTGTVEVETITYTETRQYQSACMLPKPLNDEFKIMQDAQSPLE